MTSKASARRCSIEPLEPRLLFSLIFEVGGDPLIAAAAKGGPKAPGPEIRLDLVALHEFGHSLGLDHSDDTHSIMYAYYKPEYDLGGFANDSAVQELRAIYSSVEAGPWKDSLDAHPGDGDVDLTWSFVLDGARLDQGRVSNTFATFDTKFGAGNWQTIFTNELQRWAGVSNGTLQMQAFDGDGIEDAVYGFNTIGSAQNDSRFGDIRIAAHKFDGAGKVLGHTYYPPPNGSTAAGDSHYDSAENWVLTSNQQVNSNLVGVGNGFSDAVRLAPASGQLLFSNVPLDEQFATGSDLLGA